LGGFGPSAYRAEGRDFRAAILPRDFILSSWARCNEYEVGFGWGPDKSRTGSQGKDHGLAARRFARSLIGALQSLQMVPLIQSPARSSKFMTRPAFMVICEANSLTIAVVLRLPPE
jgi:hypothetical protein